MLYMKVKGEGEERPAVGTDVTYTQGTTEF